MRIILLILLFPLLIIGKLLGFGRRDIESLPADHPEMIKAIAEAQASLPEFRRVLESPEPGMDDFGIKARFPVGDGSEHIWVESLGIRGTSFTGKLANHPQGLEGMELGSEVDIPEERVTDWAYSKDGTSHGHFTTKVLLTRMSKRKRQQIENAFGWSKNQELEHK